MTTLRQQMDNAMVLRGFAERTRESYLAAVAALAKHYHRSPDLLTSEEVQAYLLHLIVERKLAYASVNQASCSCQFLFCTVLKRPLERFDIHMAKVTQTIFHTCVGNISGLVATTSPVTVYPHLRGEVWNIRQGRPRRPRYPSPP